MLGRSYLTQGGHGGLRPCSRPTADTCTAPGPSRTWCNTSGSWWGHGTAPYPATRFSHRPPSQIDALRLGPPVLQPRGVFWFYCSLWEKDRCSEERGWNAAAPLLTNHPNISILRRGEGSARSLTPDFHSAYLQWMMVVLQAGECAYFVRGEATADKELLTWRYIYNTHSNILFLSSQIGKQMLDKTVIRGDQNHTAKHWKRANLTRLFSHSPTFSDRTCRLETRPSLNSSIPYTQSKPSYLTM